MFQHRARVLKEACAAVRERHQLTHQVSSLQTRGEGVRELRQNADRALAIVRALEARAGSEELMEAKSVARAHQEIRKRVDELKQNPNALIDRSDTVFADTVRQLKATCEVVLDRARTAWGQYRTLKQPGDHKDIIRAFERAKPTVVDRLTSLRSRLRTEFGTNSPDEQLMAKFDATVAEYGRLFGELFGSDTPPEVIAALQEAASTEGSPLTAFTPGVIAWLERREIVDSFRVKTL